MTEGKTLTELNVKPGDVVRHKEGATYTIAGYGPEGYFPANRFCGESLTDVPEWHIVSRATPSPEPTRADLEAQITVLQAKLDAMPKMMRLYAEISIAGRWRFAERHDTGTDYATHYLDIPVGADGVPIGLKEIER